MFVLNAPTKDGQQRVLAVKLPPLGESTVEVRYPTDAEWAKRTSSLKMTQRSIGRGKTKTEARNGVEVNADLYQKICLNGHSDIPAATASYVIDQLERCEVVEVTREQGVFAIRLDVKGGQVCHFLDGHLLTQDKVNEYRRRRTDVTRNGNILEVRSYLEPAGHLYDQLSIKDQPPEGYLGSVPLIHKSVAIEAVLDEIDRLLADANDDEDGEQGE